MKNLYLLGFLVLFLSGTCIFPVLAQPKGSIFNELILNKWLKNEPINTSFRDASKQSELPESFGNGQKFRAMHRQNRSSTGAFLLKPGFYELKSRSFCLRAGTHGPSSGDGYLFAPLLGRQQDIVREVLTRSEAHPEISQQDVQILLWAIIARCDFRTMNLQLIDVCRKLMKPAHMARLNKKLIMEFALAAINSPQLTASVMNVLQTENQIRGLIGQSNATFLDLERLAVLAGPARIDNPEYRQGRWSKHPDGYYVRYYPQHYSRTIIQVYVPESISAAEFDATNDVAVPANTGAQRLGLSNVPYDTTGYEPEMGPMISQTTPVELPNTNPEGKQQQGNTKSSTSSSPVSTSSAQKPIIPPKSVPTSKSLCGKVVDAITRKAIEGVSIKLKDQVITADIDGQFSIADLRPGDEFSLVAGYQDYEELTLKIRIEDRESCQAITIALIPISKPQSSSAIVLEEATIREGERFIMDNVHFEQSKSDLLPAGKAELDKVAAWMKNHETIKVELSGHTTNEGEYKLNVDLSKRRAIACKKYLMAKGIKSNRISPIGYGPDRPVVSHESEKRAQNRRVELKIIQT